LSCGSAFGWIFLFAHPQIELRPLVLCNWQSVSLSSPISRTRPNRILALAKGSCDGRGREQDVGHLLWVAGHHWVIEKSDIAYFLIMNEKTGY